MCRSCIVEGNHAVCPCLGGKSRFLGKADDPIVGVVDWRYPQFAAHIDDRESSPHARWTIYFGIRSVVKHTYFSELCKNQTISRAALQP